MVNRSASPCRCGGVWKRFCAGMCDVDSRMICHWGHRCGELETLDKQRRRNLSTYYTGICSPDKGSTYTTFEVVVDLERCELHEILNKLHSEEGEVKSYR